MGGGERREKGEGERGKGKDGGGRRKRRREEEERRGEEEEEEGKGGGGKGGEGGGGKGGEGGWREERDANSIKLRWLWDGNTLQVHMYKCIH